MMRINLLWRDQAIARSLPAKGSKAKAKAKWFTDARTRVFIRSRGRCVYCGSIENLQCDHAVPVKRGGSTAVTNQVVA